MRERFAWGYCASSAAIVLDGIRNSAALNFYIGNGVRTIAFDCETGHF